MPQRSDCRSCGAPLSHEVVSLGAMPPSNAYLRGPEDFARERAYPLTTRLCGRCFLVQLDYDVAPEELFADYAYFSSYSESWSAHARRFCAETMQRFRLGTDSFVVELASNDGYLLKHFVAAGVPVLGIDPSDTVAAAARAAGVPTEVRFFGRAVGHELAARGRLADLVVANNVLAHVPDPNDFVAGIAAILAPHGVLSVEAPHLLTLLERVAFDTIYHEHFSYWSLLAMERLFAAHGLRMFDVERLPTHGGSLRVLARHANAPSTDGPGLLAVRAAEAAAGLAQSATYARFRDGVEACRRDLRQFLESARAEGKRVLAYGAAAKGNTLLNYCGVATGDIAFVADVIPAKQGKFLPGSHLPICDPEALIAARPDYVLVLPWNLRAEIEGRLAPIRAWGGRALAAIPRVEFWW